MNTAKTLRNKILLVGTFFAVAAVSAYVGSRQARHSTNESIEAVEISCKLTAAAQLLSVSDLLRDEKPQFAKRRLFEMAKQHLSFYDEYKNNSRIPEETRASAEALKRKLSTSLE